jgi:hypothetical protein
MMIDILRAIKAIKADAQVACHGEDVNKLEWHDGNPSGITAEQITAKQAELQTAHDNDHTHKRLAEYPSIDELVVALWEGVVEERMAAVTDLEIKRQAVKAKYPK